MKGLSKNEASAWGNTRLADTNKKRFSVPSRKAPTSHSTKKIVRFANGVQLTLGTKN